MVGRKPKIEYYWVPSVSSVTGSVVVWRLVGANGEIMCQSNQGFRDKADAQRSVMSVVRDLTGYPQFNIYAREVGPGRKPA